MSSKNKQNGFVHKFYADVMPMVYGFGAALVIIGAMFKLLNLSGASVMLAAGLTTEAILFILGSFEPKHTEYDWTRVYPELIDRESSDEVDLSMNPSNVVKASKRPLELLQGVDKAITDLGLNKEVLVTLEGSISKIASYSHGLSSMVNVSKLSDDYCNNLSKASDGLKSIAGVNEKIVSTVANMSFMSNHNSEINAKMGDILSTLSNLNDSYKKEITEIGQRMSSISQVSDSMKKIAGGIDSLDSNVKGFKNELTELNKKFQSLNSIYGNMLNSFKV